MNVECYRPRMPFLSCVREKLLFVLPNPVLLFACAGLKAAGKDAAPTSGTSAGPDGPRSRAAAEAPVLHPGQEAGDARRSAEPPLSSLPPTAGAAGPPPPEHRPVGPLPPASPGAAGPAVQWLSCQRAECSLPETWTVGGRPAEVSPPPGAVPAPSTPCC